MNYIVNITSPVEREAIIRKAKEASNIKKDFYDLRNKKYDLPVVRIKIDVPIYRMANFRTFTAQKEYLAQEKELGSDFFSHGQESEKVQQIQHNILRSLAEKGLEGSVTPVIEVLKKDKQREPLLITSSGIVVNGNRRLAAMRELLVDNPRENSSFNYIDVMVLPEDVTADEIVDIEGSLQGKPETKLDYDWIGDAELIYTLLNIHKSYSLVAEKLNRSEKDIKNCLQALKEANLYLKEWAKDEDAYRKVVGEAEQFFKDLPKRLEGKNFQLENASRAIAWTLFENKEKLPSRLYDFNSAFGNLAADVLDRFSNNFGIPIEKKGGTDLDEEEFSVDTGIDDEIDSYDDIIDVLKANEEEAITILIESSLDSIEMDRGQKSGDAALKAISQAHSKMVSIDLSRANPSTYVAISKQLEAIINISSNLKENLSNLTMNKM